MNNKIKFLRNEIGESIRELAEHLDLNFTMLNRIELNNVKSIKDDALVKFCNYFRVEPNYLLGHSNEGILCENKLGTTYILTEEEYIKLADRHEIFFNPQNGRHITSNGEQTLSEMRSKDFDKNMLYIMQGISSTGTIKEIIPLLSQLNDSQLELILNTIKALLGK